ALRAAHIRALLIDPTRAIAVEEGALAGWMRCAVFEERLVLSHDRRGLHFEHSEVVDAAPTASPLALESCAVPFSDRARVVGDRGILLAVSDGMGGAAAGEVASAVSVEALLSELLKDDGPGGVGDRLRRVVHRASKRVREEAKRPGRRGMGATLTTALFCGTI